MEKLLMLGGAYSQIPAIEKAKELGYYVITCDNIPQNPGHRFSDEYVEISTVDIEKVCAYAKMRGIDGISAYASDPATKTAAYVAQELGLPGVRVEAANILSDKDLFRAYQKQHGFCYPNYVPLKQGEPVEWDRYGMKFPCIVKPVDASGSKGVKKALTVEELKAAVSDAFGYTRAGRVIIEEYIETPYKQIHGDGFVYCSKLKFLHLGDQNFYHEVPIGTSCPSSLAPEYIERAEKEVARMVELVQFGTGAINAEIRVTENGDIYIVEIGARSGGNYIPELMEAATGFDEIGACIQTCMKPDFTPDFQKRADQYAFQYIIGAPQTGKYRSLWISEEIKDKVQQIFIHKKAGDAVFKYKNSAGVVGVALVKCASRKDMEELVANITDHVRVEVEV